MRYLLALVVTFLGVGSALAGPEETVRWIYESYQSDAPGPRGYAALSQPDRRGDFLSDSLGAFHAANDTHGDDLASACVDFAFDIPGQDYDAAEIARTLQISSTGTDFAQDVTARFTNFGTPAEITYHFVPEDGLWKIDDITGPGWRVSEIPCAPAQSGATGASAAPPPETGAYCYRTQDDTLRLTLLGDGRAQFSFQSFQTNGHSCGYQGIAQAAGGAWVYSEGACQLGMEVSAAGDIAFQDPDWACKTMMCGQRAVIEGLIYPATSRVDCATLPVD